ncbi:MAG: alanine dehydrogenase [candidate division KSB1 bacterium]|nr:alanine dehydrogenase [candidate division KSB1 bacterium]MDZ7368329.1 alanine dehydrogenase [candidate division KSB1 bacterium]MDZ7403049.1 alanine dehydrogenase [candidate division KSB1 bacterium]
MIIGIPKESWRDEHRVALIPAGVFALVKAGHKVLVQSDAGLGCGFTNEIYDEAGATLVFHPNEVFERADLIVKVMPPSFQEAECIRNGKTLFSFFNFDVVNAKLMAQLIENKCTAAGYNLIEDDAGDLPVLMAMSEIAGMLLPQIAGRFLATQAGGRGIMLGGVAGIPAANVVIIGAGVVGGTAAEAFAGAGANVTVMDSDLNRLRRIERWLPRKINTAMTTPYHIDRYVETADVLVGAVMIRGQQSPHVVTETQVQRMRKGSVILDVSIDQGGCVETSRPTTHSDPVFTHHGVIHYAVPNIPAMVARTASHALNNVILPFVQRVAESGSAAFKTEASLRRGLYLFQGQCTQPEVGRLLGWPVAQIEELLG